MSAKEARRYDTFIHYGLVAAMEAIHDAGLEGWNGDKERVGVCIGSGIGGLPMIEDTHAATWRGGRRKSPVLRARLDHQHDLGPDLDPLRLQGPEPLDGLRVHDGEPLASARPARMIEYGDADVMIAGGAEATVNLLGVGGFFAARRCRTATTTRRTACRPLDRDRDGFVLGEGAGILVLEELEHAKRRGARIYCELAGFGMSADANHITAPPTMARRARAHAERAEQRAA